MSIAALASISNLTVMIAVGNKFGYFCGKV